MGVAVGDLLRKGIRRIPGYLIEPRSPEEWRTMKNSHVVVSVGLVLLLPACVFAQDEPISAASSRASSLEQKADHEALRALVPLYEQAASEGKPSLLKPHLDPEFTGVMVTGEEVTGLSALEDYWRKIRALIGDGGKYTVKVNVAAPAIIDGGLAVARGTTSERVVTESGKEYHYTGYWTAVCRKTDGQWRLLRVQASMDPISNPFVSALGQAKAILWIAIAGSAGLVVGWILGRLLARRRQAART